MWLKNLSVVLVELDLDPFTQSISDFGQRQVKLDVYRLARRPGMMISGPPV